jgi:hypothetical protein
MHMNKSTVSRFKHACVGNLTSDHCDGTLCMAMNSYRHIPSPHGQALPSEH